MKICPHCNGMASFNQYFNVYVCTSCGKHIAEPKKQMIMKNNLKLVTTMK